jgi:hypothetical protein
LNLRGLVFADRLELRLRLRERGDDQVDAVRGVAAVNACATLTAGAVGLSVEVPIVATRGSVSKIMLSTSFS